MRRYLLVAVLPVGLAAIAAATAIAARRAPLSPADPSGSADLPGRDGAPLDESTDTGESGPAGRLTWLPDLARLGAISGAGGLAGYGVMALLGPPVINHGLAIDEPIFRWTENHQVGWWAAVMERFNRLGNTWTTWGAVGTAAVCLGVSWHRQRWLPPATLGMAILVDHYATSALHRKFSRLGPPPNPLGTYPSGGTDRVVLFYGLIAHMLWREFSGSRRGKIWAVGAVTALSFNQAYCRQYLSQHWFIDIICGLFYGTVLLMPIIAAVELIAGPAGAAGS
jgi:PAP2 superfamily